MTTDPTTLPGWRWLPGLPYRSKHNPAADMLSPLVVDAGLADWLAKDDTYGPVRTETLSYMVPATTDPMYPHYLHRMARLHSGCETLVAYAYDGEVWEIVAADSDREAWAAMPEAMRRVCLPMHGSETAAYLAVLAVER